MFQTSAITLSIMLKNISSKNGKALLCIAFSFLLSNASLEAVKTYRGWTQEEDHLLVGVIAIHGTSNWETVAEQVPNRTAKQCRERWIRLSKPNPNRGQLWTEDEDKRLMAIFQEVGRKWKEIAGRLSTNKTSNQCRWRFLSLTAQNPAAETGELPEVAADGDGAAADGAVGLANPRPVRLPAPRPALPLVPRQGPAADRDGNPGAVADEDGLANPFPVLLEPRDDQAWGEPLHVPVQGLATDGDGVAATGDLLFPMDIQDLLNH
jgi:hypothetical protein